jgi:very-short-patch-repair endonuclease
MSSLRMRGSMSIQIVSKCTENSLYLYVAVSEFLPYGKGGYHEVTGELRIIYGGILMTHINLINTKDKRKKLRAEQTEAERKLWSRIRNRRFLGLKFYRQTGIGNYIADFYCPDKYLVVELDGSQHFTDDSREYDGIRTEYFNKLGIKVLRFTNYNVLMNIDGVLEYMRCCIEEPENVRSFDYYNS